MSQASAYSNAPQQLDVRAFASAGEHLNGANLLLNYERLAHDLYGNEVDLTSKTCSWTARGELQTPLGGKPQVWLHISAHAHAPMTCQRCLAAFDMPLRLERSFRFVADEATAMAQDDDCEEDLLVLEKILNLHELIEDELILALPVVPKHDVCPTPVKLASSDEEFKAALTQKPNAFAALGSLKKTSL